MRYVAVSDVKAGDVVVQTSYMGSKSRGRKMTTYSKITEVGAVKNHGGREYKHFVADMVTGDGYKNDNHRFMIPLSSNVRVK